MSYLYALSWLSLVVQSVAFTFAIGAGLFYLAEIIEEYATIAKKCINGTIVVSVENFTCTLTIDLKIRLKTFKIVTALAIGLLIFENLPLKLSIVIIASNLFYFMSMRTFPFIEINSPVFISSIGNYFFLFHSFFFNTSSLLLR